jgi:hypothetical protein
MALGSTQFLTKMSTRNLPGDIGRPALKLTTLPPSVSRLSEEMWEPQRLTTLLVFTACYRDSFTFYLTMFLLQSSVECVHITLLYESVWFYNDLPISESTI